jgi:hypothetical protein
VQEQNHPPLLQALLHSLLSPHLLLLLLLQTLCLAIPLLLVLLHLSDFAPDPHLKPFHSSIQSLPVKALLHLTDEQQHQVVHLLQIPWACEILHLALLQAPALLPPHPRKTTALGALISAVSYSHGQERALVSLPAVGPAAAAAVVP